MEFVATESNICELLKPLRFLKQLQKCEISNLVHSFLHSDSVRDGCAWSWIINTGYIWSDIKIDRPKFSNQAQREESNAQWSAKYIHFDHIKITFFINDTSCFLCSFSSDLKIDSGIQQVLTRPRWKSSEQLKFIRFDCIHTFSSWVNNFVYTYMVVLEYLDGKPVY